MLKAHYPPPPHPLPSGIHNSERSSEVTVISNTVLREILHKSLNSVSYLYIDLVHNFDLYTLRSKARVSYLSTTVISILYFQLHITNSRGCVSVVESDITVVSVDESVVEVELAEHGRNSKNT